MSTVNSVINSALSLALAAILLKGHDEPRDALTRWIDRAFGRNTVDEEAVEWAR